MKRFEKFLIVSDMDGTFFGEGGSVLQNNLDAIEYFKENGGLFTFATGRDYKILLHSYPKLSSLVSCPGILCNGTYLFDFESKRLSMEISLDKAETLETIKFVKDKVPEATFRISCNLGFLCPSDSASPFPESTRIKLDDIIVTDDPEKYIDIPWHKLVYSANGLGGASNDGLKNVENNFIPAVKEVLETLTLKSLRTTTSSPTLLELLPKDAGKNRGIKELKKLFPDRTIVCVGDYENDLDMLKAADIAASPENALDSVKQISSIHLCHHRDGCIADLIYKLDSSKNKSILEE